MPKFSGGCLCGAVRYEGDGDVLFAGHCHCIDCRKSSGTGHCSHMVVPAGQVRLTGAVTEYEKAADSGNIVTRCFCPVCGGPVYSTNTRWPDMMVIRASSLDDPEVFVPQMVVYTSRQASWDVTSGDLPSFEKLPPDAP